LRPAFRATDRSRCGSGGLPLVVDRSWNCQESRVSDPLVPFNGVEAMRNSKLAAELASLDSARDALSGSRRAEIADSLISSAVSACSAANSATWVLTFRRQH